MVDFASIASKKVEDVERPPLPPVGTYRFRVMKVPESTKSQDEAWEFIRFLCRAVEATDNVELEGYKGDVNNIVLTKTFMFDTQDEAKFEQTLFQLRQFCEKHLQCVEPGMSVAEMLNATVNAEFLGDVRWQQDKRDQSGETFNAEIGRTAPVE
jgi:spermidine/putrescine-binding protein